jgi:bifunctional enzyme CysN/CysC
MKTTALYAQSFACFLGEDYVKVGETVWLTGLSGAGKTTIAAILRDLAVAESKHCVWFDGDEIRRGLNADLNFEVAARVENVRRIGEIAVITSSQGLLSIVSAISPIASARDSVRSRHEESGTPFCEVYIATPIEVCERRDPKGHYAKARSGRLVGFTGIDQVYQVPRFPDLVVETNGTPLESALQIYTHLEASASGLISQKLR